MMGGIYVLQDSGELLEMTEQPYDSEALLQELLAKYPSLLAGDQIDPAAPRRWLLVRREAGVPAQDNGVDRWAVDHLFLDQDGVPTLVEVKRSTDTRIRREVVGQMLEYAANGPRYWPPGSVRAQFEARCSRDGHEPDEVIRRTFGREVDVEAWWNA